ncbi:hypothetical protein CRM22_005134 [Opisthorchis felineus]|uniref:PARG catalytic Macro domain-containing protein n=1 Tax=Opisthorchis felineus TaxID=147828 RepID=A0A4V3SF32_OPIFE|nr:hypothetical protein CRM22_005134 [Opisthorchis felineus]TGZ66804.1 hypothetical protein CRM22_005134 [Opisthorchis felineus]
MVHFVNAYIGGNVLRSGGLQEDSLFMRYPDLLAALPLCHRLEEFEALWIDHYRGPFLPRCLGTNPCKNFPEDLTKWRRFVLMNSSCFPNWASELQYSDACLISEVVKATAALYGVSNSVTVKSHSMVPFSLLWWQFLMNSGDSDIHHTGCYEPVNDRRTRFALTMRAQKIIDLAGQRAHNILYEALQHASVLQSVTSHKPSSVRCSNPPSDMPLYVQHTTSKSVDLAVVHGLNGGNMTWTKFSPLGPSLPPPIYQSSLRHSISNSIGSSSVTTTYPQSSIRSSFSRRHSPSTQWSLRRYSDLSSNGGSRLFHPRATDRIPSSELLGQVEDDFWVPATLLNNVAGGSGMIESTSHTLPATEDNACTCIEASSSTSLSEPVERKSPCAQSAERSVTILEGHHTLDSLVNCCIDKAFCEAYPIAQSRLSQLRQYADDFMLKTIRTAFQGISWLDRFTQHILQDAQLNQSHANQSGHEPPSFVTTKRGDRRFLVHPYSQGGGSHRQLASNRRLAYSFKCDDTSSNSSSQQFIGRRTRALAYHTDAFPKIKHFQYERRFRRRESFGLPKDIHKRQQSAFYRGPQTTSNATPWSCKQACLAHFKFPTSTSNQLSSGSLPDRIRLDPYHVHKPDNHRLYVTNRLYRYAESVATSCCVQALQVLHIRSVSKETSLPASEVRPPGVITTGWGKHTINPGADPQVKVMTQWIAAAVALSGTQPLYPFSEEAHQGVTTCSSSVRSGIYATQRHNNDSTDTLGCAPEDQLHSAGVGPFPVVVCTNNDPKLSHLGSIVRLIYSAKCSAGRLLALLLDYGTYRLGPNEPDCQEVYSRNQSAASTVVQPYLSLFEFLTNRLNSKLPG